MRQCRTENDVPQWRISQLRGGCIGSSIEPETMPRVTPDRTGARLPTAGVTAVGFYPDA